MARVLYTGSVSEIRGSVAGSTYQRNPSGTIVKNKNNQRFSSSNNQLLSQQSFSQIATMWSGISAGNKDEWNAFAHTFSRTDFYSRVKSLNGFQWFGSINRNLLLVGAATLDAPPADANVIALPTFTLTYSSSTLDFNFLTPQDLTSYYVVCFATAPTNSIAFASRTQKLFLKRFTGNPISTVSLKSEYEALYGVNWSDLFTLNTCVVKFNFFTVSLLNGVSSAYTGAFFVTS